MFVFGSAGSLVVLALWVFCLIDVITSAEHACRNLPAGRPADTADLPYEGNTSASVAATRYRERAEEQRGAYRDQQRRLRDAQEGEPTP